MLRYSKPRSHIIEVDPLSEYALQVILQRNPGLKGKELIKRLNRYRIMLVEARRRTVRKRKSLLFKLAREEKEAIIKRRPKNAIREDGYYKRPSFKKWKPGLKPKY